MIKTTQHLPQDPQVRDIVYFSNRQELSICPHQKELECFGDVDRGMNIVAAKVNFQRIIRQVTHAAQDEAIEATFILEKNRVLVNEIGSQSKYLEIDITEFDEEVIFSIHQVLLRANQAWKGCSRCKGESDAQTLHGRVHELEDELAQEKRHTQEALQTVREQQGALDRLSHESLTQGERFSQATQNYKRELEARDAAIEQLRSDLQRDQKALREMTSARDAALEQNEGDTKIIADLKKSIQQKTEEIATLKGKNESLQTENARLIESHEQALQKLGSEHDQVSERQVELLDQARRELEATRKLLETAQREHAEQIERIQTDHTAILKEQQGQIHDIQNTLEGTTRELQEAQEKMASDQEKVAKLHTLMSILESRIENLELFIDQLKGQHEDAQRKLLESLQEILGQMNEVVSKEENSTKISIDQLRIRQVKEAKLKSLPLPDQITQVFAELKMNFSVLKAKMNEQDDRIAEQDRLIDDLTKDPMQEFEIEEQTEKSFFMGLFERNTIAPETKPKTSIVASQQAQLVRAEKEMRKLELKHAQERETNQILVSDLQSQLRELREQFRQLQIQFIDAHELSIIDTMENIGAKSIASQMQPDIDGIVIAFTAASESLKRQVAEKIEIDSTQSA